MFQGLRPSPILKLPPWFQSQMGVQGADSPEGLREHPDAIVLYVDSGHLMATDNNDGTNPLYPKATVQSAVSSSLLTPYSEIRVSGAVSLFQGNIFGAGVLIATLLKLDLRGGSQGHNIVTGNVFGGDYSNTGGYYGNAANPDMWVGNVAEDVAEAEVGDNGWTIGPPAA